MQCCKAITTRKTQCKHKPIINFEFCRRHQKIPEIQYCNAITTRGVQCGHKSVNNSDFCKIHQKLTCVQTLEQTMGYYEKKNSVQKKIFK